MQQFNSALFWFGASCLASGTFLTGCGSGTTTTTTATSTGSFNYQFESFRFLSTVTPAQILDVETKFFALKSQCVQSNLPVIASISGGPQNAPEQDDNGQGYTEGFVTTFQSEANRAAYQTCTARTELDKVISPLLDTAGELKAYFPGVEVFDYTVAAGSDLVPPQTVHMVFFRFKSDISIATQTEVMDRFSALKTECTIDGTKDGRPLVQALVAGDATETVGPNQLFSQGYYVQFASAHDRDVYIGCPHKPCQKEGTPIVAGSFCQAHDDFKVYAGDFFEDAAVPSSDKNVYDVAKFGFNFISEKTTDIVV